MASKEVIALMMYLMTVNFDELPEIQLSNAKSIKTKTNHLKSINTHRSQAPPKLWKQIK